VAWRRGPCITGFASGERAESEPAALVRGLAETWRVPADELGETVVLRWQDEAHVGGCDLAFAPGQLTRHGAALRATHGCVHFAGSERICERRPSSTTP
jgi:monoamine oxidase